MCCQLLLLLNHACTSLTEICLSKMLRKRTCRIVMPVTLLETLQACSVDALLKFTTILQAVRILLPLQEPAYLVTFIRLKLGCKPFKPAFD